MTTLLSLAAAFAVLLVAAFALAPRREIVTAIAIDAPPAAVWAVLADTQGHARWNPFIVAMRGALVEGARLTNTLRPAGGSEMTFRPTVLKVVPGRELRWLGRLGLPRIFDGEHYFVLEARDGGTHLVHGERFRGVALWFLDVARFRADFEAMNAALKAQAEAAAGTSPSTKR